MAATNINRVIITGNPTNAAANRPVPTTTTTVGQCMPADNSVNQGTPSRSNKMANTRSSRRRRRRGRARATDSTSAAGESCISASVPSSETADLTPFANFNWNHVVPPCTGTEQEAG